MKKKKKEISFVEKMRKFQKAGIPNPLSANRTANDLNDMPTLEERIQFLLKLINTPQRPSNAMLFFIMYDIESNRVRNQIAKYLIKNGCTRIQKSVFLADLPHEKYEQIKNDLTEVQACYENEDSILVVPISTDYLQSMKIIGKTIDIDLIMQLKNTLFF
ncbi:MAG: CRISPR-associated endonuclease Cas2 [Paludibacteraceae bacterium]|jgi:CRISPR-associated protein Cas2|nr:CRISPR-associated endonuclease Cas2 [Paludibacteraceae bacterium]HPD60093.1 CRISPR-associated endonuclease Cas2 [Paludibacteraceae bacterium]